MGSCFSSETDSFNPLTAKVISVDGSLREYFVPVNVSQVLQLECPTPTSFFLCNSDKLFFDDYIPALDSKEELQEGQIYFILPVSRLQYPLTAREMAALAVKASVALMDGSKKSRRRQRKIQISPVFNENQSVGSEDFDGIKRFGMEGKVKGHLRSTSVRKMQRSASRRAKIGYRSFRAKLSTIHEGFVAE
ncbi:uncharacterized protein LOC131223942 [Magnolia sinica]|uniref:uncharacterized protein LOC131223942 n=1 Tax=Magnolia sinica TaxID=86752 RepID=UPI002658B814|nr:uncharacterized protein LOC131223942 [Magnolia sinica]